MKTWWCNLYYASVGENPYMLCCLWLTYLREQHEGLVVEPLSGGGCHHGVYITLVSGCVQTSTVKR